MNIIERNINKRLNFLNKPTSYSSV